MMGVVVLSLWRSLGRVGASSLSAELFVNAPVFLLAVDSAVSGRSEISVNLFYFGKFETLILKLMMLR